MILRGANATKGVSRVLVHNATGHVVSEVFVMRGRQPPDPVFPYTLFTRRAANRLSLLVSPLMKVSTPEMRWGKTLLMFELVRGSVFHAQTTVLTTPVTGATTPAIRVHMLRSVVWV